MTIPIQKYYQKETKESLSNWYVIHQRLIQQYQDSVLKEKTLTLKNLDLIIGVWRILQEYLSFPSDVTKLHATSPAKQFPIKTLFFLSFVNVSAATHFSLNSSVPMDNKQLSIKTQKQHFYYHIQKSFFMCHLYSKTLWLHLQYIGSKC